MLIVSIGKVITLIITMFLLAIFIVSISLKNNKIEDKNCKVYNQVPVILNNKTIDKYTYYYRCNTLYIFVFVNKTKDESIDLDKYFKELLKDNEANFVQIEIEYSNKEIGYCCFKL